MPKKANTDISYTGHRVFIIPMQLVGIVKLENREDDKVLVRFGTRGETYWFSRKDVRLWTKERARKCGISRECWKKYEY